MPRYSYECPKCGNKFEEFVLRISDGDNVKCPECQEQAKKVWGKGSFAIGGCPNTKR